MRYATNETRREKIKIAVKKWRNANPTKSKFRTKRNHAEKAGIPFTIKFEEVVWPEVCPVFGVLLDYRSGVAGRGYAAHDSPSFDRIDPTKGYIPGNVAIISHRANRIKSDATPEELETVAAWLRSMTCNNGDIP